MFQRKLQTIQQQYYSFFPAESLQLDVCEALILTDSCIACKQYLVRLRLPRNADIYYDRSEDYSRISDIAKIILRLHFHNAYKTCFYSLTKNNC